MSETRPTILPTPILCLVTDLGVVGHDVSRLADILSKAVDGGVNMVQVRAPDISDVEFGELVTCVNAVVDKRSLVVVNPSNREVKRYLDVDGLQLSEVAGSRIAQVRELYGDDLIVGRSVHSVRSAKIAMESGADFLVLGTIFPSVTHPGGETHGVEGVGQVVSETNLPVIGIGGISADNAGNVVRQGAVGVAVVRSILAASHPGAAARELMDAMKTVLAD